MLIVEIQVDERFVAQVDTALVERAVAAVLDVEGIGEPAEVSVLITTDETLQSLNQTYRGIDAPTDVLSFGSDNQPGTEQPVFVLPPGAPRYLGDIAVSYERVEAQAAEYGHTVARELAFLTVHGTLHLLGYDHERSPEDAARMRAREEAVLDRLGLPRD